MSNANHTSAFSNFVSISSIKHRFDVHNSEAGWAEIGRELILKTDGSVLLVVNLAEGNISKSTENRDNSASPFSDRSIKKGQTLYDITSVPTDDILNLQYFFPYCDQYLTASRNRSITLLISGSEPDINRARCYLVAQTRIRTRLGIFYASGTHFVKATDDISSLPVSRLNYDLEKIGSLFPLLRVGLPLITDSGDQVAEAIPTYVLAQSSSVFYDYIEGTPPPSTKNSQLDILYAAGCHQISVICNESKGTSESSLKSEEKDFLLQTLWDYVKPKLKQLPLLTQLIWIYSLYLLTIQKELLAKENDPVFHRNRADLALWDSIAYGEGLLQLLENCEQHSCLRAGFLTIVAHNIGMTRSGSLLEAATKRERIYRRYRYYVSEPTFLSSDIKFVLEFNVTDMAYTAQWTSDGIEVHSGGQLDKLFAGDVDSLDMDPVDKIIHHYGLPLFQKTVQLNKGRFLCITPSANPGKSTLYYSVGDKRTSRQTVENMQAWTTYRILLPVTYLTSSHEEKYHTNTPTPLFDPSFLPDRPSEYEQIYLTPSPDFLKTGACLGAVSQFERKSQLTRAIREWLVTQIPARNRVVFTLDLRLLDTSDLEAFSKGIFYYLAYRDGMEQLYLLLRLVFRDELALCEFLRRASIFYSRSGQNQWLSKVQMAFCVPKDKNLPVSEQSALESDIWVILAGSNLNTAYATAMLFSHYNLRGFETLLPQIRYFVRSPESKLTSQIQAQPQFPFDLVRDSSGQSQFLRHMTICLERDLQEETFGCKIQNAHLRLGSKIHITDFFEAELLFYSIGNTYRFAYLIAEELISELLAVDDESRCKELILVGYESYSSILVSQVAELVSLSLKQKGKAPPHIIHMQYLREDDGTEHISLINGEITDPQCENTACAFILPIGTTLSTIYKIRNVLFRQFADQLTVNLIKMLQSYAVIVVGDRSEDQLSKSYWSRSSYNPATIELTAESEASSPIIVHNFMALQTTWYLPTQCPLCGNAADGHPTNWAHPSAHIPLIQTDKTSTLPNLIFPLYREGIRGISFLLDPQTSETNRQQLTNLKGHIQYGHIFEGSNHFQFYIDYIGFYAKEQGKCQRWLADLRHRIDANAFNIIVSPRSRNDCLFLKDVVDIVFQHNLRLLFLPLETVFREDIRARFSYITTEYLAACESDRKPKINIYYVDYTLVSGAMLQRGKSLVNMLLSEVAAPNVSNISLFQKVILLINRSSYDTINSIIPDPDQNFMAYATLAVSTFNTHQGRCPTCELTALYQEISKCCATNELYWHFQRLAQKHQLRSAEEHAKWQRRFQAGHPHCLQSFFQHLYVSQSKGLIKDLEDAFSEWKKSQGFSHMPEVTQQQRLNQLSLDELFRYISDDATKSRVESSFIQNNQERDWIRLISTHDSMILQESMAYRGWKSVLVNQEIFGLIQKNVFSQSNLFHQREWLISYLKVLSRGYLAKLAPIRKSVFSLLELILLTMVTCQDTDLNSHPQLKQEWIYFWGKEFTAEEDAQLVKLVDLLRIQKVTGRHESLQMYQLYLTVCKRLCDLQSNLLMRHEMLLKIQIFLQNLLAPAVKSAPDSNQNDTQDTLIQMIALPTRDQVQTDYVQLIKWAAMSSAEESKAFLLQSLANTLLKKGQENALLNCPKLGEILSMENTRLVYTGVKRLDELCQSVTNWNDLESFVQEKRYSCLLSENPRQYRSQNPLSDLFRFLDRERDISMSVLSGMLGFYRLAKEMENGTLLELQKNYIAQYDKLCFYFNQIAGSQSCCLIHQQNGNNQIIAQSLWKDNLETHDQIHVVLRDVESRLSRSYLHNTVIPWRPSKACQGNYHSALVLTLRIQRRQDVFQQQNIYIVLLFQDDPQSSGMTNNISRGRYVLFMRQPLQQLLERDLYALHHFRITYQDVFPLSKSGSPTAHDEERDKAHDEKRIKECMTLLHLTDLHITAQSKEQILKLIGEQAAELKKGNPDLLLITGDAVQSNSTAIDLERNYQAAREVIQALAVLLWPNTSEDGGDAVRPRPDWRKRIVIIPGNHDYATMNELSATHILRTTSGGTPVLKDGSPMSRYSYYIQFLQELLQVDMSVSIRNGLNQIREYSELGIRVIALNSVAEVGPLRNNKVQLDEAYIERQPDVVPDANGYFNICMAHHTVYYRPDYVADRYYEKEMNPRIISQLKEIIRVCADGQQKMVDLPSDRDRIKVETQERLDLLLNQTSYQILGKYHKGSALYSDIEYLKEHWSILTNERCQQIISDFSLHEAMSARDYGAYTERLTKLAKKYPIHIMLGGHTHQAGQTSDSFCFHGPRFYYGEKYPTLYFGRLILKRGEELPWIPDHYEFFPDNQLKETLKSDQPPINIFTQPK